MTTMFIDTNGEMSFVDNERLKFIMHYLKQGADYSLVAMKDRRFIREDSELSFTEIWIPAAEHQQRKIDEQQAKVEGLEGKLKQAYEDVDTFATAHEALEQRVDRDRSLIQFTQKANKDLIAERDELQKQFDQHDKFLLQRNKDVQELYDINVKHAAEKEELQKRVDLIQRKLNAAKEGHYGFKDEGADIDSFIFDLEQALKGEG
ncbi:hypothetical protein [Acinetobacter sp. GN11]